MLMKTSNAMPLRYPWARLKHAYDPERFNKRVKRVAEARARRYFRANLNEANDDDSDDYNRDNDRWTDEVCEYWPEERQKMAKTVFWVSKPKESALERPYIAYGNEANLDTMYMKLCLIGIVPEGDEETDEST